MYVTFIFICLDFCLETIKFVIFIVAFADAIQRAQKDYKNKHVVNRAIILFIQKPHYLRFSLLLQRYVRKGNDAKNAAILGFSLLPKESS